MFISGHFHVLGMRKRSRLYFLCCDQKLEWQNAKSFRMWQQVTIELTQRDHSVIACWRHIYLCVSLCAHPVRDESHFQCNTNWEDATTSLPFCNEQHLSHVLFCEGCTWRHLRILVKAPHCCDWKGRATNAQSFTLLQQATLEIPRRAHSIICLFAPHTVYKWRAEVWWCPEGLLDWMPPSKFWYWAVAYGGHCYWIYAVCDVTIWRHIHVCNPTFRRSLLTQRADSGTAEQR